MSKFLIEVPHEAEELACARIVKVFLASGSHFLRNADWGCGDGNHSAWMLVDVESKDEARNIVPPSMRHDAKIIALNGFTMDHIDEVIARYHRGGTA